MSLILQCDNCGEHKVFSDVAQAINGLPPDWIIISVASQTPEGPIQVQRHLCSKHNRKLLERKEVQLG